jgi:hypothetical protein
MEFSIAFLRAMSTIHILERDSTKRRWRCGVEGRSWMQVELDSIAGKHIIEVRPAQNCGQRYDPVRMTIGVNAKFLGN